MASEGLDRRLGVESAQQDRRRAEQRGREVLRPEAETEGRGQGAEKDLVLAEIPDLCGEAMKMKPAELVVEHDLGKPRGAGGRVVETVDVRREASPFEGLAEKMNWLQLDPSTDTFAQALLEVGVTMEMLKAWTVDPQVVLPDANGKKGSLFDQLEDMDFGPAVDKCKALAAAQS